MRDIELFFATSWEPNKEEFLSALGISTGGLGEQFFGNVFDAFFVYSIDAKNEFNKYYSIEYGTFHEYFYARYGKLLSEAELDCKHVFVIGWIPDVISENYDENKMSVVVDCIRGLEGKS
ncbi:hypothetical protein [Plesiomonas shigelloides]|uniref:hypothetical protein n=1 Tax=Plesiomonas shigelloides TaxID=703 RepID=UPI00387F33A2